MIQMANFFASLHARARRAQKEPRPSRSSGHVDLVPISSPAGLAFWCSRRIRHVVHPANRQTIARTGRKKIRTPKFTSTRPAYPETARIYLRQAQDSSLKLHNLKLDTAVSLALVERVIGVSRYVSVSHRDEALGSTAAATA